MDFEILFEKILMRIFIWQPPTVQGLECCHHKKNRTLKCSSNFVENPIERFPILANVITLNLHLGISGDLKQETQLKCEKASCPCGDTAFSQPEIWRHHMYSSSRMWQTPDQRHFCHTPKNMTTTMICHLEIFGKAYQFMQD